MSIKWIVIVCLGFAQPTFAQGLSERECAEIQSIYQITPPQCGQGSAPGGVTLSNGIDPTGPQRENNVFFPAGGTQLDGTAQTQIQRLAAVLNTPVMQDACLRLVGHSDSSGSAAINLDVGAQRASAVRAMLGTYLNNPNRIEGIQSRGEDMPLPGLSAESKWQRRVEIWARNCG